jgi:hypothetical protein
MNDEQTSNISGPSRSASPGGLGQTTGSDMSNKVWKRDDRWRVVEETLSDGSIVFNLTNDETIIHAAGEHEAWSLLDAIDMYSVGNAELHHTDHFRIMMESRCIRCGALSGDPCMATISKAKEE